MKSLFLSVLPLRHFTCYTCVTLFLQILADASAVDAKASAGEDVGPLCGLAFAVKDNIDVAG